MSSWRPERHVANVQNNGTASHQLFIAPCHSNRGKPPPVSEPKLTLGANAVVHEHCVVTQHLHGRLIPDTDVDQVVRDVGAAETHLQLTKNQT